MEETLEEALTTAFPEAQFEELTGAYVIPSRKAVELAQWLKSNSVSKLDYLSCVSGVDYLPKEEKKKQKNEAGETETVTISEPGRLEVVYHLYSMELKSKTPFTLKQITDRETPSVASLTPIYRSAEFQEREVFDLYGIHFEGHPDLRRLLMWETFEDFPMRKDYVSPNDYEYEPTPHGDVIDRAKEHIAGGTEE